MDNKLQCFVMMPIRSGEERAQWLRVLHDIIDPAVRSCGQAIDVERVDLIPRSRPA